MNKNLIVVLYFGLAALGLALLGLVAILAPDLLDKSAQYVLTVLGLASTAAVTIYMLGKQAATLEEVKTQTNGNTTRLLEQLEAEKQKNAEIQRQLVQVVGSAPPADSQGRHEV